LAFTNVRVTANEKYGGTFMLIVGGIVVLLTIYLLIKRCESRMVLMGSVLLMATLAGTPLSAFDSFATSMVAKELIQTICPVMGFAYAMRITGCDKHLISLVAGALKKVRPLLIPGAVLGTFVINISLPSAAGTGAAVGAIFIPLLISCGVHPATAAAAVLAGTFGSNLSPGLPHNPFVAKLANTDVMMVIAVHAKTDIICDLIAAFGLFIMDKVFKNDKVVVDVSVAGAEMDKTNLLYAIVPIVLLILGTTHIVPILAKVTVATSMLLGAIIGIAVTRKNPAVVCKEFFKGMGIILW
jgi:DcuC family C4-dicarboxylate transporter